MPNKQYKQKNTNDDLIDIPLNNTTDMKNEKTKKHNNINNDNPSKDENLIIDKEITEQQNAEDSKDNKNDKDNMKQDDLEREVQQMDMETTLTNLKIISQIKKGEKISINEQQIIEIDNRYVQSIRRWFWQNSRKSSMDFFDKVIKRSFEIIDETYNNKDSDTYYFNEESHTILQKFFIELTNTKRGLSNLKETYTDDVTTNSQLDIMIEKLTHRIEKIKEILKIE